MTIDDKVKRFEKLTELKNKLYELHGIDKFEAMTDIYNEIRKHDKELADTLTLITSDFNTQLNIQQNHFINILDNLITLEEKKLISEVGRVPTSRSSDMERHMEEVIQVNPVINITNTQDGGTNGNNSNKGSQKSGAISEDTAKVLENYKWHILIIIVLVVTYFNPDLIDHVFKLVSSVQVKEK
jgi:hypothetical protein